MIENEIKRISDLIEVKSGSESKFFPVDRTFLEPYIPKIMKLNRNNFLLYNLERVNNTYTVQLLFCLPEIWDDISVDDLIIIMNQFTNQFSFYALITLTYRFIEINIIGLIFTLDFITPEIKKNLKKYLYSQFSNLFKSEADWLFMRNGLCDSCNEKWMYIKQKFLLDSRIKNSLHSQDDLFNYINSLTI